MTRLKFFATTMLTSSLFALPAMSAEQSAAAGRCSDVTKHPTWVATPAHQWDGTFKDTILNTPGSVRSVMVCNSNPKSQHSVRTRFSFPEGDEYKTLEEPVSNGQCVVIHGDKVEVVVKRASPGGNETPMNGTFCLPPLI